MKKKIREHFDLKLSNVKGGSFDPECHYYLLLCSGAPVTVRSQQLRAINLAWALEETVRNANVAVIGGGAAGITFAAIAAKLGANVKLFERSTLMHLQVGSWHRPLHPEIFTWPDETAYRPVSHVPVLGWAAGTAHEVATEIRSKFRVTEENLENLSIQEGALATLSAVGSITVDGKQEATRFLIVVLAVGFGVEDSPLALPLNSYWRADALDQSFLSDQDPSVVVSGAGDGALIEVLRSCVQEIEQGPFLDKILALTMSDTSLLNKIKELEEASKSIKNRKERGKLLWQGYKSLEAHDCPSLPKVDRVLLPEVDKGLKPRPRNILVSWLYSGDYPFEDPSLPINRFLVSRLICNEKSRLTLHPRASVEAVSPIAGGRYLVEVNSDQSRKSIICDQALFRWGAKRYEDGDRRKRMFPELFKSVARVFDKPSNELLGHLNNHLAQSKAKDHSDCNKPAAWTVDNSAIKDFEYSPQKSCDLLAKFEVAFKSPDPKQPDMDMVYRIRIWLPDLSEHLTVRYDLHPATEKSTVTRVGVGGDHEQWLNTRNDYEIRLRTSDGIERSAGSVITALERWNKERPDDSPPIRRRVKQPDHTFASGETETFEEAMKVLKEQSKIFKARKAKKS
jgi:hypothetical protein